MLEMKFVPVKPVYNGHPWGMARWPLQQGDRDIQVNFAENIRQLKILGSYPVTVIHNMTTIIYRAVLWGLTVSKSG